MIRQTFDGLNPATDFAQIESRKQNKKLSVFLTRNNGVQYMVCDSENAKTISGKLVASYGEDVVYAPKTFTTPPVVEPIKQEEPEPIEVEEKEAGNANYVKDIDVDEVLKTDQPIAEPESKRNLEDHLDEQGISDNSEQKPKKTRKKKQ